jgi:PAS domain S-box-containing protein
MTKKISKSGRSNEANGVLLREMLGSGERVKCLELVAQSLAHVGEAISLTDPQLNRFLHINPAWVRLYGYPAKKVIGEKVAPLLNMPDIAERIILRIRNQTRRGGWEGRLINRNRKGHVFTVSLRTGCLSDLNGDLLAFLGVAIPVANEVKNSNGAGAKSGRKQHKTKGELLLKELELLTEREQEIFTLFGQGFNTRQAAEKLEISPYTVQTHRNHLKEKLNVTTADELNFLAYQWVGSRVAGLD